jgi:hypothetical protein
MSLEDEVERILDSGARATPAGIRALTEGVQYVADPIGDILMPMLASQREAILRIAREIDEGRDISSLSQTNRTDRVIAALANRFAKPS